MIFTIDDQSSDAPRSTALFSATAAACEANLWTSVNGLSVARVFTAVNDEYNAAVSDVAVTDFGAAFHYSIRGPQAATIIARATSAPAMWMDAGDAGRGLALDSNGFVQDLVDVACMAKDLFLLSSSLPLSRMLQLSARGLDASYENLARNVAALGVLGPGARGALEKAGYKNLPEHGAVSRTMRGVETAIRMIGFGESEGFELIFPQDEALIVWERLIKKGKARPIGLDALEIIRIEGGAPRPRVDFNRSGERSGGWSPAALGLSHLAPENRGWFGGRRALKSGEKPLRQLVALQIDADRAAPGASIAANGKPVGRITSCAYSPRRRCVVAMADISALNGGKTYEFSVASNHGESAAARLLATPESALETAYLAG